nr:MAG TPA: hypothetical protein [Caudoviricetes sp.]
MSIDCFNISEEELNQMIQDMKKIDKNVLDHPQVFSQFQDSEAVEFPDLDLSNIEGEKVE